MSADYKKISVDGLWKNNAALVQVLGLCPLLAVSNNVVNSLGLAIATALVLIGSNVAVSLFRNFTTDEVRLPAFVMIIAALTTAIELLMQAFTYELYQILGIFIPLITTNCTVLGRADAFASKNSLMPSFVDGLMMGVGFGAVLVVMGALREIFAAGTLFADMHLLFGPIAQDWTLYLVRDYQGFLLAALPPGAFIALGFLIAGKNWIDAQIKAYNEKYKPKEKATSRRVRTTGNVA